VQGDDKAEEDLFQLTIGAFGIAVDPKNLKGGSIDLKVLHNRKAARAALKALLKALRLKKAGLKDGFFGGFTHTEERTYSLRDFLGAKKNSSPSSQGGAVFYATDSAALHGTCTKK
jgi:hypothetical protein